MIESQFDRKKLFLLLESQVVTIDAILSEIREFQVHEINKYRHVEGEFHTLFHRLRKYPNKFYDYTRMSVNTFDYILEKVSPLAQKNWCNLHQQPIFVEERLVVTLRILAAPCSYSSIHFSFRIGKSTVCGIFREMIVYLWEALYETHMPEPTEEMFKSIAHGFYKKCGMPHCIGAIDGKHIEIRCPFGTYELYYNYKKFYSIVLQGTCDHRYKFIAIDVGGYGKQSDGGTFMASDLYQLLMDGELPIPDPEIAPESDIVLPFYFVGDAAYPLMENLMKPYPGTNLPDYQFNFNNRLSAARRMIECTFGILAMKWRILLTVIYQHPETVNNMIKCICVLHNTIIDMEGSDHLIKQLQNERAALFLGNRQIPSKKRIGLGSEARDDLALYLSKRRRIN